MAAQQKWSRLVSMRMWVQSLASIALWLGNLALPWALVSATNPTSDLAVALIGPLAWELPWATGAALKKKKKKAGWQSCTPIPYFMQEETENQAYLGPSWDQPLVTVTLSVIYLFIYFFHTILTLVWGGLLADLWFNYFGHFLITMNHLNNLRWLRPSALLRAWFWFLFFPWKRSLTLSY